MSQPDEDGRDYEAESRPNPDEPPIATEHEILCAMKGFGGGFMKALAEAYLRGDGGNRAIIRAAFREYWEKYAKMAILARNKEEDGDVG